MFGKTLRYVGLFAATIWVGAAATPSRANIEPFAEFHQLTTIKGVHWIKTQVGANNSRARLEGGRLFTKKASTSGIGDAAGELSTSFSFLDPTLGALLGEGAGLLAGFKLDATVTPSTRGVFIDSDGNFTQDGLNGSFDFIYRGSTPISDGSITITNGGVLLHADFNGASLSGKAGGSTIGGSDSTFLSLTHNINYTSPFIDFTSSDPDPAHLLKGRDFVIGLAIAGPGLSVGPNTACTVGVGPCAKTFNTFNATASGFMGATAASVPEPAAWALMIVGFGSLGVTLRRHRSSIPGSDASVR